jgi:hypothetical protein
LSGKAMEATVPPSGTVLREMLNREFSEGHCWVCGLFITWRRSICRAKGRKGAFRRPQFLSN